MSVRNKLKSILKDMRVTEVSLVDEGDNPGADVVVVKRRDADPKAAFEAFAEGVAKLNDLALGGEGAEGAARAADILKGMNMDIEELNAKLGQIEASLEEVGKAKAEVDAKLADAEAALADRDAEIAKLKAEVKTGNEEDEVLKGLPESIRKRLENAEAAAARAEEAIAKANDQRELEMAVTKAKGLGFADPDKLGGALHRIAKGTSTADDAAVVEEALQKANAALSNSKLFEPIGKGNGGNADQPEGKLRQAALDIQKAKPNLSYEAAYAEAMEANPSLYDEVVKARRAVAN